MVFIHGGELKKIIRKSLKLRFEIVLLGGFVTGSSDMYGASYFMDEQVILVTLNYRLAALGNTYHKSLWLSYFPNIQ